MKVEKSKVSIIIPTYNRAHLIGETLDSISKQTYSNWECLVVDDGSTDASLKLLEEYKNRDARFLIFERPDDKAKGANACRNIGLNRAIGDYIVFFDSDDIMTSDHIEKKLHAMLKQQADFVIAKTKYLDDNDPYMERYYTFHEFEITAHNYIVQNLNWLTLDTLISAPLAKSIQFNESLQSGQEYNYFSKLVVKSTDAIFIEEYLSLRRKHEVSIQSELKKNNIKWKRSFKSMWLTYLDVKDDLTLPTKKVLLYKCIRTIYRQNEFLAENKVLFLKELYSVFGFKSYNFTLMLLAKKYFNKGYSFREKFKSQSKF